MNVIIKHINLNVRQPNNFQLITAMQNDNETIKVIATLYDGNSLYTIEKSIDIIRLTGRAANDAIIDCLITDYTDHTVTFVLTKNMLSSDGDMKLSISMTDSSTNQTLSTYLFIIKVHNSPIGSFSVTEIKTLDEYVQKAKDYADEAKNYATAWTGSLLPQGDITFAQLPTSGMIKGYLYCVTNFFNTDSRFEEGVGYFYPAGTCVYWTENNQWKCLSGVLSRQISQADYDNLSEAEKNNGTIYYIDDGDNEIKLASSIINGLMSADDKKKLDGIEDGANKTIVDSALSSTSTNPVQNKVINTALDDKSNIDHEHTTINGHTVNADVPANAKFTDTTYEIATTKKNGLMSADDKKKLDGIDRTNVKYVEITQSEYDKLATIESNVIYFITD